MSTWATQQKTLFQIIRQTEAESISLFPVLHCTVTAKENLKIKVIFNSTGLEQTQFITLSILSSGIYL